MSRLAVHELVRAGRQRKQFRRPSNETGGSEMCLQMLSKIIRPPEELPTSLNWAFVRTFLGVGAIVTFEMLHASEALATVTDVELVGAANNEGWRPSVASSTSGSGAGGGARDAS
uniref:Uncharacterized protein n=1 Tax=Melanopsichium pennsylvanicum 4 TaxID=1398559 RepID=A0A077R1Q7_9BASI|nr:uncharacterized protein BN887_06248 [Melanopsichium pennsylvanicum 4]